MSILGKLIGMKKPKEFSAWQIELTTRCPLQCRMCVRAGRKDVQHKDMFLEDFRKIVPHLANVETVVLEGWGESLMHRQLTECIGLVKEQGARVGFVTSGSGLTASRAGDLVEAGVDFIGFSLAGVTEKTHNKIRVNSRLDSVLGVIKTFQETKKQRSLSTPVLHIVYLMLKDNVHEVPELPSLAKQLGIHDIILLNIIQVSDETQADQRVFICGEDSYEPVLQQAEAKARELKIRLIRPALSPADIPVCDENPLKNLYVSVDGDVSPCVYLCPPVPSPFSRIFCWKHRSAEKVSFGNIFNTPFASIWESEPYLAFRKSFEERKRASRPSFVSVLCQGAQGERPKRTLPDPPAPCKTCHKILGF